MSELYTPGSAGWANRSGYATGGSAGVQLPSSRYVLPSFIERTNYGMKEFNPYNKLFEERIIFLGAPIDDVVANDVIAS